MIDETHVERLRNLRDEFLKENAHINLSALRTEESCWVGNILDSLAALEVPEVLELPTGSLIADAGTGGGFPFLPLSLCMEHCRFVGIDSIGKKLAAIERIAKTCALTNASLLCGRLEEIGRSKEHRDSYDAVTARALAPLNVLIEYCAPLLKPGGLLFAWKSMHIDAELTESLSARSALSCHLIRSHEYVLPDDWGRRQILVFRKIGATPSAYPRETGLPKKHPIGSAS